METLFVILGIVLLAVPITVVVLLVLTLGLRRQVNALTDQVRRLEQRARADPPPPGIPDAVPPGQAAQPPAPEAQEAAPAARVIAARAARMAAEGRKSTPAPLSRWAGWVAQNWFYVISAVSLALAGLFLVQYGAENGLFPPVARVIGALIFGAALIGAGLWIARRSGDGAETATAYLPSVFCGAGTVSLFGAVLAARQLYGLIGAEAALLAMVLVAAGAMAIGWRLGPLLAGVGVIGAFAAPFVVGGASEDPSLFYAYFAVIAAFGLGIDTLRRWAWVSVLSVALAYAAALLLLTGAPTTQLGFALCMAALPVLATLIPARSLRPDHSGGMIALAFRGSKPIFPVWLAGASLAASSTGLAIIGGDGTALFWLSTGLLTALSAVWTVWSQRAPALQDQTLLPAAAFAALVVSDSGGDVAQAYVAAGHVPEGDFPWAVTALVVLAVGISLLAAWRSLQGGTWRAAWAGGAAVFAPGIAALIELTWQPATVIGAYPWALHAAALAAVMTALALRFAALDGPEARLRAALCALSALACLAFALLVILSLAALTAALAVTIALAAWLDRRFGLRAMGLYIAVGVAALGYRLLVAPGLDWALEAPWAELALSHGSVMAALICALWLLRGTGRAEAQLILDSAIWSVGALSLCILLWRLVDGLVGAGGQESHWTMGLIATIWLAAALAQVQRLAGRRLLYWLRAALGLMFGLTGLGALALGLTLFNPVLGSWGGQVVGPTVFNTLALAYALPAAVLAAGAWRIASMPDWLRYAVGGFGAALAAFWVAAAIRHAWQGPSGMPLSSGTGQGELYTYTIALLLLGAALFYQSLARQSALLRRAGLAVLGLAVAKVFFVDISGLAGLVRVVALLVLGLSLAALAWLDRWATGRANPRLTSGGPEGPTP